MLHSQLSIAHTCRPHADPPSPYFTLLPSPGAPWDRLCNGRQAGECFAAGFLSFCLITALGTTHLNFLSLQQHYLLLGSINSLLLSMSTPSLKNNSQKARSDTPLLPVLCCSLEFSLSADCVCLYAHSCTTLTSVLVLLLHTFSLILNISRNS